VSNPRELRNARRKLAAAQSELDGILSLPRHRGAQVVWSNGVVWTRAGDDTWLPWTGGQNPEWTVVAYSSAHVASGTITRVAPSGGIPTPIEGTE
jgi:hypothetical protein